jgi:hypothetical protein
MFPDNLRPMPLKRHREPFSSPDYFFELKHDGFRALAFVQNGKCRLVSRNANECHKFDMLASSLPEGLNACAAVLDGELVCLDHQGRSQFNELLFGRGEPRFCAFDLLWCEGKDLRFDGLHERKPTLKALIQSKGWLLYCDHIEEAGERLYEIVCRKESSPSAGSDAQTQDHEIVVVVATPDELLFLRTKAHAACCFYVVFIVLSFKSARPVCPVPHASISWNRHRCCRGIR